MPFYQMERSDLRDIANLLGLQVQPKMSLFDLLYYLVSGVLQCEAEECHTILSKRLKEAEESTTHSNMLLEVDEAAACLVEEDRRQLILEQDKQGVKMLQCKELHREFSQSVAEKVGGAKAGAKKRPRPKFDTPYPRKLPVLEKIPQQRLKALLPPEGLIWRSRSDGAWNGRWGTMPQKSARDSAWGGEERAVRAVLRHCWGWYLDIKGFTHDQCPIGDLWDDAAGSVPALDA